MTNALYAGFKRLAIQEAVANIYSLGTLPGFVDRVRQRGVTFQCLLPDQPQIRMTIIDRKEFRERTHLEIAMSAAVAAGLARSEAEARKNMDCLLEQSAFELKAGWRRERGGGIKGWFYFLRSFGFEERLIVKRIDTVCANGKHSFSEPNTFVE
jgi:hypothetical protein